MHQMRANILCVDDEPAGLHLRKLILSRHGYSVETATNAPDALQLFKQKDFDLVITDHLLGRGNGTAMARDMKGIRPGIPIIVLSGTVDIPEGLGVADAFMSKTDGPDALLERVREMIEEHSKRRSNSESAFEALKQPKIQQAIVAAIIESSDDAIFSKSLDGMILTWNSAAEHMYGYDAQEVIGKNVRLLVPPELEGELHDILKRLSRGEKISHLETRRIAKDGTVRHVLLTIQPILDAEGLVIGAATTARDITEVRMAEQAVKTNERLALAGRMAATVAHEINNPLEAVTNILYLLRQADGIDSSAREFIDIAEREVARIRQIAQLTLTYHRQSTTKRERVNLPDLVDGVLTLYGRRIETLGLRVSKEYTGEGTVEGVSGELRQVISNLILNAVDALEQSGNSLRIHVHDVHDKTGIPGIKVTISDDGPGISNTHLRSIFQPFYTTKGEKGTGLGLWVSRGIIEKHGGNIHVRSAVRDHRKGTTFSVFLPSGAVGRVEAA